MHDTELLELIPHFERLAQTDSVYSILKQSNNSSLNNSLNNQTTNNQIPTSIYIQPDIDYEDQMNQQVPMVQQQQPPQKTIIYQAQQVVATPDYNNDQNHDPLMYNNKYVLKENKLLLSIDLKQQQLQNQSQ